MGYAINPSLNYLHINENHILEFYRSTGEVDLPDTRFRGHPFEAYICISRVETETRGYVALLNTSLQTVLIYTSDFAGKKPGDSPQVLAEAEAFVTSMGFTMEKVKLDFSPAMREVILKGFRVMRPPPPPKKQPNLQPKVTIPAGLGKQLDISSFHPIGAVADQDMQPDSFTELQTLRAELASTRGALAQATRVKVTLEQRLNGELSALKAACEQAMEAKRLAEEKLARELSARSEAEQSREDRAGKEADLDQERHQRVKQQQLDREEISALKKQLSMVYETVDAKEKQLLRMKEAGNAMEKQLLQAKEAGAAVTEQLLLLKETGAAREKQLLQELTTLKEREALLLGEKGRLEQRLTAEMASSRELLAQGEADRSALEALLAEEKRAGQKAALRIDTLTLSEKSWKEGAQQTIQLSQRLATVEGELETAKGQLSTALKGETRQEELQKRLTAQEEELRAARSELAGLRQGDLAREELSKRLTEKEEELKVANLELERLRAEEERQKVVRQQLEITARELEKARANLQKSDRDESRTRELQSMLADVKEELAGAKGELDRIRDNATPPMEPHAGIIQSVKEKEAVEAEYVRLANSSREKEHDLAESLAAAEAENERLSSELEIQAQMAAMEQAALRAELRRIIVQGNVSLPAPGRPDQLTPPEQPPIGTGNEPGGEVLPVATTSVTPVTAVLPVTAFAEPLQVEEPQEETDDDSEPVMIDTAIMSEFTSDFGGMYASSGSSGTEFRVEPSISCIEYSDPAEISALFCSSNTVQAVPDSSSIQRCRGYVAAVKQEGSYRVYVAWHLTESGKVVVCLPDRQPVDSDSCVQILKDAIAYFEIIGFMMDPVDLGTTVNSYRRSLKKIPVVCSIAQG